MNNESHNEPQSEGNGRDHKKLGRELDLYYIDETVGKGLPLFTAKGASIRRELERFIVDEEIRRGYEHVYTPDIAKLDLYIKSGHYPYYKDSMYAPIEIDDEKFMLRPMTCPHHFQLYLRKPHSYRELPMRIAEIARLYRYEQSGELMGLQRVRTFCLADAHIICATEEQAAEEVSRALDLIEYVTKIFGLEYGKDYHYRLSLGDTANTEKYYKNDEAWEKGESLLRALLKKRNGSTHSTSSGQTSSPQGNKFVEAKNDAAFYGPKIDIQMKNANGKEDTAFTVQYDFCMPDRFDLTYIGEDGNKKRAFVVHRSSIGAIERIMAFLIEHYAGAFPLWLSPIQIAILPIGEKHIAFAKQIYEKLFAEGLRVELHDENETLGKKIREAKKQKIPYFAVLGDKEIESNTITLESRDKKETINFSLEDLLLKLKKEIAEKK
ncbi:MAG: threonine--tRNA ligase [bacterium]|nr:threonine--tRNA ligase [bacterium]